MLKRSSIVLISSALLLLCSSYAQSQVKTAAGATEVACVSGCSGGTTATDNGTVTGGSSTGTGISFLYLWDGANWKRATGTTSGLNVICTSGCGSPPATADNTAFSAGTTNVSPTAFVFNNSITALTSGSYGAARVTANRVQLHINWDAAGNERGANVTAANALVVDGSATTQPISAASLPLPTNAATDRATAAAPFSTRLSTGAAFYNALQASDTLTKVTTVDTITNAVTTTPPANASTNVTQFGGVNISTGTGAAGTGIPRVTISNDSSLAANQSVNVNQLAGTTTAVNNGPVSAGVQRVTIASDSTGQVTLATGANTIGTVNQGTNNTTVAQGWTTLAGAGNQVTATWTNATAAGSTLSLGLLNNFTNLILTAKVTSTITAGTISFKCSDDSSNFFPVQFRRTDTPNLDTNYNLIQSTNESWYINTGGWARCQVSLLNAIQGSGSLVLLATPVAASQTFDVVTQPAVGSIQSITDTSGNLAAVVAQLAQILSDTHSGRLPAVGDKAGFYLKSGLASQVVSQQNPLPVILPDSPDPCNKRKGNVAISQTTTTKLVAGQMGYVIAICYIRVVAGAAEIPSMWEGTGSACATGTLAVSGSTTAANGESYAANGGFSAGVGIGTIATTLKTGDDFCLAQSGSNRLAGNLTYVYYIP